jgi:hypothetical protein
MDKRPASAPPRQSPPMRQQPGAGAMWTVQGPDGQIQQLPHEVAQKFIKQGAKRIA